MPKIDKYRTPKGTLELIVERNDSDSIIGFSGFYVHTHGDVLIGEYKLIGVNIETPELATNKFIEDMMNDKVYIILQQKNDKICHVHFSLTEPKSDKYLEDDETEEIVFWSKL